MQQTEDVVLTRGDSGSWLSNAVIQRNLRLTIPNGDAKSYEKTRELTDADVREVVAICDAIFRSAT